jgi:Short C-terminal domain
MGKHTQRRQEEQQGQAYDQGQQDAYNQGPPAGSSSGLITSEATQRLGELGKLHEQGVLNDDEFAAQKAKILGTG